MTKQKKEEQVLRGIKPLMKPGESLEAMVETVAGPWQYLTFACLLVASALAFTGNPGLSLLTMLAAVLFSFGMRSCVVALTSDALYVGRLRWRKGLQNPEVYRHVSSVDYERVLTRMRLGQAHYWVTPVYLGEDTYEFERSLRSARAVATPA